MNLLPFNYPGFSWQTLESFLCLFLQHGLEISGFSGEGSSKEKVLSSKAVGIPGGKQYGVDIEATMSNGEKWVFQCKHYIKTKWTKKHTEAAIRKTSYVADRYFLVITQMIGEEPRQPIDILDKWDLWDIRQLSNLFLGSNGLSLENKTQLIRTHFTKEICYALLKTEGDYPYLQPESFFLPFEEKDRVLSHGYPWIKNVELEKSFRIFLKNKKQKLFILSGIGGSGKSRFLKKASSKQFLGKRNKWKPVFLLRIPEDIESKLSELQKPCLLFLDEAEKESNYRRLFSWALRAESVKLVLASRPLTVKRLKEEAVASYIESEQIQIEKVPEKLSEKDAIELAENILGKIEANAFELAKSCSFHPLLIVAVCYLIRSNKLTSNYLLDDENLRDNVYKQIIKGIFPEYSEGNRSSRLLKLIALLSPMAFDDVEESLLRLLDAQPYELKTDLDELQNRGLVVERLQDQFRIYPDVLGEFILFEACYRENLKSSKFAESFLDEFPNHFPKMMRNIANAEWAARRKGSADNIFLPFFEEVIKRYKNSAYDQRNQLIKEWSIIAEYHPRYTLALVDLMLEISREEKVSVDDNHISSLQREYILKDIPNLLDSVAKEHEGLVETVLDKYWECLCSESEIYPSFNDSIFNKAIELFDPEDYPHTRCLKALEWLKNKLTDHSFVSWLELKGDRLVGLLGKALELEGSKTENTNSYLLSISKFRRRLESVMPIREAVLIILKKIVETKNDQLISDCLRVFSRGIDYYNRHVENEISETGLIDLGKWFKLAKKTVSISNNPALYTVLQLELRRAINWTRSDDVRKRFIDFNDHLTIPYESKIIKFLHTDYGSWFNSRQNIGTGDNDNAKSLWREELRKEIRVLERNFDSPVELIDFFDQIEQHVDKCRITPMWYDLLTELSDINPKLSFAIALQLVNTEGPRGIRSKSYFLFNSPASVDNGMRDSFVRNCLDAADEFSMESMLLGLFSWTKEESLTIYQQETIRELCETRDSRIWHELLSIANLRNAGYKDLRQHIYRQIPEELAVDELTEMILHSLYFPNVHEELIREILSKIIRADFQKSGQFQPTFSRLSKDCPEVVADFFEQRIDYGRSISDTTRIETIKFEFSLKIELDGRSQTTKDRLERLFKKSDLGDDYDNDIRKLLSFLKFNGEDLWEKFLLEKLSKTERFVDLEPILHFIREAFLVLITNPDVTGLLLKKLREFSDASLFERERKRLIIWATNRSKSFKAGQISPKDDIIRGPLKKLLLKYESEPILFPFYSEMLEVEEAENRRITSY